MYEFFNELPQQLKEDLITWYNCVDFDPDGDEKTEALSMVNMVNDGQFKAWDCPDCGDRVYLGEPDDWSLFQGVNQADFSSYPGNTEKYRHEYIRRQCDDCRSTC